MLCMRAQISKKDFLGEAICYVLANFLMYFFAMLLHAIVKTSVNCLVFIPPFFSLTHNNHNHYSIITYF